MRCLSDQYKTRIARNAACFKNHNKINCAWLHIQFSVDVKFWFSARLLSEKWPTLVITGGFLCFIFWKKNPWTLFALHKEMLKRFLSSFSSFRVPQGYKNNMSVLLNKYDKNSYKSGWAFSGLLTDGGRPKKPPSLKSVTYVLHDETWHTYTLTKEGLKDT